MTNNITAVIDITGEGGIAGRPFAGNIARDFSRSLQSMGLLLGLILCGAPIEARQLPARGSATPGTTETGSAADKLEENRLWMVVGTRRFVVTLSDNATGRAFAELLPLKLKMEDLNANEKKVQLPKSLPGKSTTPGHIHTGDLMLYRTDTLVLFYVAFPSPYSYSRIGRVDDPAGLANALGRDDVVVEFSRYK